MVLESNTRTQLDIFRKEKTTKEDQIKRLYVDLSYLQQFY